MFDERVRASLARAVKPVAVRLARAGVTPNAVSVTAFGGSLAAAALVASGYPRAGLVAWLLSRLGDALDGILARAGGRSSAFGGYLDITLDMAAYSVMALAFAVAHPEHGIVWPAILLGYALAITTTLALSNAAAALGRRVSDTDRTFQFTTGIAEAGETTVMYVLWVVFPGWLGWLAWIWVAMIIVTVVQRSWLAYRLLH
jgi:phosphatidylglycerophosphate synthase